MNRLLNELLYPEVVIMIVPFVLVGFIAANSFNLILLLYATVIVTLGDLTGNVLNNYGDWEIDEANNKRRYLHKRLSRKALFYIFIALSIAYFALGLFANMYLLLTMIGGYLGAVLYSTVLKLKDKFIFNNLTLGFVYGLVTFCYGYFAASDNVTRFFDVLWIPLYYLVLIFSLSIIKDYEDVKGDKELNVRTFVTLFGKKKAMFFQTVSVSIIVFCILVFNILRGYNFILVSIIPYLLFLWAMICLNRAKTPKECNKIHVGIEGVCIIFALAVIPYLLF